MTNIDDKLYCYFNEFHSHLPFDRLYMVTSVIYQHTEDTQQPKANHILFMSGRRLNTLFFCRHSLDFFQERQRPSIYQLLLQVLKLDVQYIVFLWWNWKLIKKQFFSGNVTYLRWKVFKTENLFWRTSQNCFVLALFSSLYS